MISGSNQAPIVVTKSLQDRFWRKVKISQQGDNSQDLCWLWTASTRGPGYGAIRIGDRILDAHVVAWRMEHGGDPVPEGKLLRHTCGEKRCVRPSHLQIGTPSESMLQAAGTADYARRKLTKSDVLAIMESRVAGSTMKDIAKAQGVPYDLIKRLFQGRSYWYWTGIPRKAKRRRPGGKA